MAVLIDLNHILLSTEDNTFVGWPKIKSLLKKKTHILLSSYDNILFDNHYISLFQISYTQCAQVSEINALLVLFRITSQFAF